jgi:uncharacterized membrane protein
MYAAAHRFHWSMVRQDVDFRNTAFYPPFLYAPGVLAVWVGRALELTIIQTLYLARGANAVAAAFLTFLALVFARRTRIGLTVVAILPMTITLDTSASQDALIISLVILAVGAIDRIIDSNRAATRLETLLITLMLLLPAMARPPYAALSGLLLLTAPKNSLRAWISAASIVTCMGSWWLSAAGSTVTIPPGDPSTQWASTIAHPTRLLVTAWSTLLSESKEAGVQLIGVLGWQDTRLAPSFIELAGTVLAFALVSSTTGPARRPWLAMLISMTGIAGVFLAIYFLFTSTGAAVVNGMQGRYFLPLVAVLALALPALPWLGYKLIPVATAGAVVLAIIEPAVVIRTIAVRYYLSMG